MALPKINILPSYSLPTKCVLIALLFWLGVTLGAIFLTARDAKSLTCGEVQWGAAHLSRAEIDAYAREATPSQRAFAKDCLGVGVSRANAAESRVAPRKNTVKVTPRKHRRHTHSRAAESGDAKGPVPATPVVTVPPLQEVRPTPPNLGIVSKRTKEKHHMLDVLVYGFAIAGVIFVFRGVLDWMHTHNVAKSLKAEVASVKTGVVEEFDRFKGVGKPVTNFTTNPLPAAVHAAVNSDIMTALDSIKSRLSALEHQPPFTPPVQL